MWLRTHRHAFLAAALALVTACREQGAAPQLQLITTSCGGTSPLEGVTHLRLRVTGEGLSTPIERVTPVNIRPEDVPAVPPGAGRMLEVRGYTGEPTSAGKVVSVGRSGPFEMPAEGAPADPVRVILRRVETFVPVEDAERPGTCLDLLEPRAGHTATLLPDGRVLLAGGFRLAGAGGIETLSSVEFIDPMARTQTLVPDVGVDGARRAFHTASLTLDGRVALAGGEVQSAMAATPLRGVAVFNPATRDAQRFELAEARTRHAAAVDIAGRVLLVGGTGQGGAVLATPEGVEPAAGRSFPVPTPLPRVGVSVEPLPDGQRLVVAGGSDGTRLVRDVQVFAFNGTTFAPMGAAVQLRQGRQGGALAPYEAEGKLLVLGGYSAVGAPDPGSRPIALTEILDFTGETPGVAVGPSTVARAAICAQPLGDGRVLAVGGAASRRGRAGEHGDRRAHHSHAEHDGRSAGHGAGDPAPPAHLHGVAGWLRAGDGRGGLQRRHHPDGAGGAGVHAGPPGLRRANLSDSWTGWAVDMRRPLVPVWEEGPLVH